MLLVMKTLAYRIYRKIIYFFRRIYVSAAPMRGALTHEKRPVRVIVSLTSYPERFSHIHIALKSIMLQTMKPDKIIVWLDDDVDRAQLTPRMLALEKYGIEYRSMPGDFKPHKKYFHAMQEFPDDIIVTVDDDQIYSRDMIETLIKTHERYPDAVCARRVHKMTKNPDGTIAPYNEWLGEYCGCDKPSHALVATGVGGVLYPPHCLYEKAFDTELITRLCLKADDIWLKFMELLNGTRVVWAPCRVPMPCLLEKEQGTSLRSENVGRNRNDAYFSMVRDYFNVQADAFEI
ncbi:MAG: glycosyltransferase [Lachnospiraceae bacterium]|nr:glycosyltransferase [Lachnospiraceae bacterium]